MELEQIAYEFFFAKHPVTYYCSHNVFYNKLLPNLVVSSASHPSLDKCTLITDKPEIEQEETFIHTGEGDQTEVICIIHSSPHAEVSWFKDGLPLDQTNHVINQRGNRHTLTIAQVDSSKFGQYTCKASNQYGEDEKTTEVSGNTNSNKQFTSQFSL